MPKMRAAQVPSPRATFEIVEREVPEPGPGSVRIKVQESSWSLGLLLPSRFPPVSSSENACR
jgi:hypothetical protein